MVLLAVLFILPPTGSQIIYDANFRPVPVITLKKTCKWPAELPGIGINSRKADF